MVAAACNNAAQPDSDIENKSVAALPPGNAEPSRGTMILGDNAQLVEGTWEIGEDDYGIRAVFVDAQNAPALMVACNKMNGQMTVERPGTLNKVQDYSIVAGGERFILNMTQITEPQPTLIANIHPSQPILGAMAVPGSKFTLLEPGVTQTHMPASPHIQRVIDTCLNLQN